MSEAKSALETLMGELKRQRDELRLQMHLAGMEARAEYDRLSQKCDQLSDHYEPVTKAVSETSHNSVDALRLLADELKLGFQRVSKALTEDK
ncbi:MAG: hypothetical protein EA381_20000 [Planctomycetaceae bacterium]|nr:MAG: hypothetical protein EA381_20000 [Planctomycetaceae bacterium]